MNKLLVILILFLAFQICKASQVVHFRDFNGEKESFGYTNTSKMPLTVTDLKEVIKKRFDLFLHDLEEVVLIYSGKVLNEKDQIPKTMVNKPINFYLPQIKNVNFEKLKKENKLDLLNQLNKFGQTPLIMAIKDKDLEGFNLLLKYGADITVTDKNGKDILYYINNIKDDNIIKAEFKKIINKHKLAIQNELKDLKFPKELSEIITKYVGY